MPRSTCGGRHELGQNFLNDRPTIEKITALVADTTSGAILEIGAGDGALTRALSQLGRPVTAIDIDEHRVHSLRGSLQRVRIECADALDYPLREPVVVGNIPFHLTTPILRRLLTARDWRHAVLMTQWEVARKRAGVGGRTMMTAQAAPWYEFRLEGRIPARCFTPKPSVDGGLLSIARRRRSLIPIGERHGYETFVRAVFTGSGGNLIRIIQRAGNVSTKTAKRAITAGHVPANSLPRDLDAAQWSKLWREIRGGSPGRT